MDISHETPAETHARLERVIRDAALVVYDRPYAFVEVAASAFPALVVCGQNSGRGGIFDYWAAPLAVAEPVVAELRRLRGRDR